MTLGGGDRVRRDVIESLSGPRHPHGSTDGCIPTSLPGAFGAPFINESGGGLSVEITDGDSFSYRGNLFYDSVKVSVIRLGFDMTYELRQLISQCGRCHFSLLRSEPCSTTLV